jgi:hypothetical protein
MYKKAKTSGRLGDEFGICGNNVNYPNNFTTNNVDKAKRIHIWDSPEEALRDDDGAALELYYDNKSGIDLSQYLGIHYVKESLKDRSHEVGTWKFGQEREFGLHYEFNLVDYLIDTNKTRDSRYADWGPVGCSDDQRAEAKKNGQLVARNVSDKWTTIEEESATSVDREPLVQVLVKNDMGDVLLDGYILVHITATPEKEPDNKEINLDPYPSTFDLCNDELVFQIDWAQFSYLALSQQLDHMTKEYFDAHYEADIKQADCETTASGESVDHLYIFKSFTKNGDATPENKTVDKLGYVRYFSNWLGTTNHRFEWWITATELEELTHDKSNYPVEVVRYIRFKEKAGVSPRPAYPYIYVKMTAKISRKEYKVEFAKKNEDYWFGLDGKDAGWDAIIFDVKEPTNGGDIIQISRNVPSTLLGNAVAIKNAHKYYFAPKNEEIIALPTEITGKAPKKYLVTARSGQYDANWNTLYCKYITTPKADSHPWNEATLDEVIQNCAIDYTKGAFTNDKLYAYELNGNNPIWSTRTIIANLDQANGEIVLINNQPCRDILNAVEYVKDHKNIYLDLDSKIQQPEMCTWLALVANNGCDVATKVSYEKASEGLKSFLVSWQRPINMDENQAQDGTDAWTNGNHFYVLDFLKLFDWRGPEKGYMWGDQQWFWAYYNVNYIKVDLNPARVMTNMHNGNGTFVALNTITTQAEFYASDNPEGGSEKLYETKFKLTPTYDYANMNDQLLKDMGIKPENKTLKAKYGVIHYFNNGDNVEKFSIRVPITIGYEWGEFTQMVQINIDRTLGN